MIKEDGLSNSLTTEKQEEIENPHRSRMEEDLIRNALSFMKSAETKWCDARGQSGVKPGDIGDHHPIPADTICAVVVTTNGKDS